MLLVFILLTCNTIPIHIVTEINIDNNIIIFSETIILLLLSIIFTKSGSNILSTKKQNIKLVKKGIRILFIIIYNY